MIEERTQPTRAYISYITYFRTIFLLNNYSLRDPLYIRPDIFLFSRPHFATYIRDPHSRLTFATHIRDPISRLTFATHLRDSHSRLIFATRVRDSTSRLAFATTSATLVRDSRSRSQPRLAIFLSRLPSCDSTTDGRTVLTPQRHLPSVLTLKKFRNLLPGLASTTSYHPPSCPPPPPPPQWLCVP